MYHCKEILYYATETPEELQEMVNRWPFKGGIVRDLDIGDWETIEKVEFNLTPDRRIPLRDAQFKKYSFTKMKKVKIGMFPNGSDSFITIFAS